MSSWIARIFGRRSRRANPDWPEWYRTYWRINQERWDADLPLREVTVVVLDGETTGLDVNRDQLISLGGLRVLGNVITLSDQFERYLPQAERRSGDEAIPIHGIIPNSRRLTFTTEGELLRDLLEFVGHAPIVGHHIGFDLAIIDRMLRTAGVGPILNPRLDTAELAQRLVPRGYWRPATDYSLDALARRYRVSLSDRHTALGDCYITGQLWLKLLTRIAEKRGSDLRYGDVFLLTLPLAVLLFPLLEATGGTAGETLVLIAGACGA